MIPSRLFKFKNMGIPPPLRSLLVIHPSLCPSVAVQLRFRLQLAARPLLTSSSSSTTASPRRWRSMHTSSRRSIEASPSGSVASSPSTEASTIQAETQEPRLQLTFTCTVANCSERSSHSFTKRAYERGIVIVQCPNCKNRHLIADHLGWFKETSGTGDGTLKTIEDIMRAKGEKVSRSRVGSDGVVEYTE